MSDKHEHSTVGNRDYMPGTHDLRRLSAALPEAPESAERTSASLRAGAKGSLDRDSRGDSSDGGDGPRSSVPRPLFQADEAPGFVTGRGGTRWAAADAETLADIWVMQQQRDLTDPGAGAGAPGAGEEGRSEALDVSEVQTAASGRGFGSAMRLDGAAWPCTRTHKASMPRFATGRKLSC